QVGPPLKPLAELHRAAPGHQHFAMSHEQARARFERFERWTDLPLAFLALLIVPALILEERAQSIHLRTMATGINWLVWLAFCGEYVTKLLLAPSRRQYVRGAWFDLCIILL